MADVVGAELDLVAFGGDAGGGGHDAGVEHEDVEAVAFSEDGPGRGFDGVEGGEVELEGLDDGRGVEVRIDAGELDGGGDVIDGGLGALKGAGAEPDARGERGGGLADEFEDGLLAEAAVATCHENGFAMESRRGDVGAGVEGDTPRKEGDEVHCCCRY